MLASLLTTQLHLSHTDLARILRAFQVSYAVTWLLGGIFLDAVGTRIGLAVAVVFWSVVNMCTGFASSILSFVVLRFLLGMGEGVNWPGASKAVAEWFPGEERSLAVAIFDSGSSVGGALAAMMIPWIALAFGWRWAFVFSGMLGFLWLVVWLRVYHPLDRHPRVTAGEVTFIEAGKRADRIKCNLGRPRVISNLSDCHKPSIGTQPMSASNSGMRFSTCHFSLLLIMFFAAFGTNGAFAHFTTARLSGVVTDNVNAAMPDATVTALQVSTGYKQTAKTGAPGDYLSRACPSVPTGLMLRQMGSRPSFRTGLY